MALEVSVNHVLFAFEFETRKKGKIRRRKNCDKKDVQIGKRGEITQQIGVHAQ